jgi:hypothetical protein
MKKDIELLKYEMPSIGEYTINNFIQEIIARYLAWKINRKWKRYIIRKDREKFVNLSSL